MDLFKKSIVVGVSVTPGVGLEVAQIDFEHRTILKYGVRPLEYNQNQREIADLDIFKDSLQDLLDELEIPKGSEIVLNIPNVYMKISDYPASMERSEVEGVIEDELNEHFLFKDNEACFSLVQLPTVNIQFNKYAFSAVYRSTIVELVLFIKDLGYKIRAIDTSINSTLNAMMYTGRVNTDNDVNWLMMIINNTSCFVVSMLGNCYVDIFEEKISIGEVLGDEENYSTIIKAVEPILKNIPSKYLFVLSKTDIISAESLANRLKYSSPITYQEANCFRKENFIEYAPGVNEQMVKSISPDIIGAAIQSDFVPYSVAHFNLFNKRLGEIFLADQPLTITINGKEIVLTNELLIKIFIGITAFIAVIVVICLFFLISAINKQKEQINSLDYKINEINKFLEDNKNISADLFDEGIEIKDGIVHNKSIYTYYTIVGTEIPQKLWLTHLKLSDTVTIEGQADNLESIYSFFRSLKDYNPDSNIKLQKLGLATNSSDSIGGTSFDSVSTLTSLNADYYEFRISNEPEVTTSDIQNDTENNSNSSGGSSSGSQENNQSKDSNTKLPDLEPIKE